MHLINDTLYSLLLFMKTGSKRDGRGSVLYVKILISDKIKTPDSKSFFFPVRQYLATVGLFFVYIVSDLILRSID